MILVCIYKWELSRRCNSIKILKTRIFFNLAKKDACNVENVEEELRSVEEEDQNNQLDNIEGESETVHS